MYKNNCSKMKNYTHLLIYIFVVEKTVLTSRAVYTDVFHNYSGLHEN